MSVAVLHYSTRPSHQRIISVPDPVVSSSDAELHAHVERVLSANYELDREIGRGGMGIVYKARDKRLKRQVAVKLLPPELAFRSEIRSRFLREAETAAQLSHPNIVPIFSVDEREGLVYFVMGYVEGDNLAKRLHDQGPMDVDEARRILCETADALAFAHARGVVHRDIKPDNILLDKDSGRAMVTDFGIARVADANSFAERGEIVGTAQYMSPEQVSGESVDGRSDLFSLGVTAYYALSGKLPFDGPSLPAVALKIVNAEPPRLTTIGDVPTVLVESIERCLAKKPDERFANGEELAEKLGQG